MRPYMRSFLDSDDAPHDDAPSSMIKLGNPATMLPTNAITDLAVTGQAQPVPSNPASPMEVTVVQPLAIVNPGVYRSPLESGPFSDRAMVREMDGLGADPATGGLSKNLVIVGIIGVAIGWYLHTQGRKKRA